MIMDNAEEVSKRKLYSRSAEGKRVIREYRIKYERSFEGVIRKRYWNLLRKFRKPIWELSKRDAAVLQSGAGGICGKEEFIEWAKNDKRYQLLHLQYVEMGFQLKDTPVIELRDPTRGYQVNNLQWITFSEQVIKRGIENPDRVSKRLEKGISKNIGREFDTFTAFFGNKKLGTRRTLEEARSLRAAAVLEFMKKIPV